MLLHPRKVATGWHVPIRSDEDAVADRRLALLPLALEPGAVPVAPAFSASSLRLTLGLAWLAALVTLVAAGVLLGGALQLSARRADFVSAVTHELRTPLTTFRIYTEMLAGDMRPADRREKYLETLHQEAERLSHLVGNVLAFSRLERGARPERVLVTRSRSRPWHFSPAPLAAGTFSRRGMVGRDPPSRPSSASGDATNLDEFSRK